MNELNMSTVYQHFRKQSKRRIMKRFLTELSQKMTLESTRKMSNKFRVGNDSFCPCSLHKGDRFYTKNSQGIFIKVQLQRAHVGVKRSDIIDSVLNEHTGETDSYLLLDKVMKRHCDIKLQLVCQSCNKKLE